MTLTIAATITTAVAATITTASATALEFAFGASVGFGVSLGFRGSFFVDQRLPVRDRNLVVVGVDFGEGEKPMPIAAVLDEGGLQRRLDASDLGEIDVAAEQLAGGRLVIKFLYATITEHHDPGLFRVGGIDKHLISFVIHCNWVLGGDNRARDPAIGVL